MKPVALITSKKWGNAIRGDLALQSALKKIGVPSEIICWNESTDWTKYSLIILRSCWDYYDDYQAFLNWLSKLSRRNIPVANGVCRIRNNIDKEVQTKILESCSIKPLPHFICDTQDSVREALRSCSWQRFIMKPSVSSGGHNTFLLDRTTKNWLTLVENVANLIFQDEYKVILQPFVSSVKDGEVSLIFFEGKYSHSVIRYPGVLGKKCPPHAALNLDLHWMEAGHQVCRFLQGEQLLYMRIDLVEYMGQIWIMEVEMAEPDLYFHLGADEQAAPVDTFAQKIRGRVLQD